VHFGLKIWRNFESNQAKWKLIRPEREHPCNVALRRAMSTPPLYTRACTPMPTYDRRTKAACRGYCAPKVGDALPTPRPVPHGRRSHARARTAFLHWLSARRTSPTASAPCRRYCGQEARAKPPRRVAWPITPPSFSSACPP
jgi:hypothetical protein